MNTLAHSPALWLGAQDGKTFGYHRPAGALKAPAMRESRRLRLGTCDRRADEQVAMTATLERDLTPDLLPDKPCECPHRRHHPGHNHCDQDPKYGVRIRHWDYNCYEAATFPLCQNCLDEALKWAAKLVGWYCSQCLLRVREVSDLVGPVMTL